jgi:hypothetical protein
MEKKKCCKSCQSEDNQMKIGPIQKQPIENEFTFNVAGMSPELEKFCLEFKDIFELRFYAESEETQQKINKSRYFKMK